MARTVRDARLDTRSARQRLPIRSKPYWRTITEGTHLGYRRGARGGKWLARWRAAGSSEGYREAVIGEADDFADADGDRILNFAQAQDAARRWCSEQTKPKDDKGPYTVGDALDDYIDAFTGKSLYATRKRADVLIRPTLGTVEVAQLTPAQIAKWHRERAAAPARLRTGKLAREPNVRPADSDEAKRRRRSTANRDLTVLKAALNRAFREGKCPSDDAWRRVKPFPKADGARLRYLSDSEARRLVNACDPSFRPMVVAALLTGARYGELAGAQVRDFDEQAGVLWLTDTKAGKPRPCYLDDEGVRHMTAAGAGRAGTDPLFRRPDGKRWNPSQQARPLAAACAAAKLEPTGFHDLRRTYGARLALRGVPLPVIAQALGHADTRITARHYAHLSTSYVSDTIRTNVAGLGIVDETNVVPVEGR